VVVDGRPLAEPAISAMTRIFESTACDDRHQRRLYGAVAMFHCSTAACRIRLPCLFVRLGRCGEQFAIRTIRICESNGKLFFSFIGYSAQRNRFHIDTLFQSHRHCTPACLKRFFLTQSTPLVTIFIDHLLNVEMMTLLYETVP